MSTREKRFRRSVDKVGIDECCVTVDAGRDMPFALVVDAPDRISAWVERATTGRIFHPNVVETFRSTFEAHPHDCLARIEQCGGLQPEIAGLEGEPIVDANYDRGPWLAEAHVEDTYGRFNGSAWNPSGRSQPCNAFNWLAQGRNEFDRDTFRQICRKEGLDGDGDGRRAMVYGIKSFCRRIDALEDRCDDVLAMAVAGSSSTLKALS